MKNLLICLMIVGLFSSCSRTEEVEIINETNKVLLLKVDYLTNVFEGGKEFEFSESDDFTISSEYQGPGDFGSVSLHYEELDEMLFDGTIVWMGTGTRSFPSELSQSNTFSTTNDALPFSNIGSFENVIYSDPSVYSENTDYANIWNSINNLEVVLDYRDANPNGKVHLFFYAPSVGVGDPAEWDWYVFIKN